MAWFNRQSTPPEPQENEHGVDPIDGLRSPAKIVADARVILDFTASHAIPVTEEHIETVLKIDAKIRRGAEISAQDEFKLRVAYRQIVNDIAPRSLQSIRDTHGIKGVTGIEPVRARAPVHVKWYGSCALVALLFAIIVQIYWVAGASLARDVNAKLNDYDRLTEAVIELEHGNDTDKDLKLDKAYTEMESIFGNLRADAESLRAWNQVWMFLVGGLVETSATNELSGPVASARIDHSSARLVLHALVSWLTPLLFGLLGSFVFVIRKVSEDIRNDTFTAESRTLHIVRLFLGPLAGISVGLLLSNGEAEMNSPETLMLKSLSPFALAFIAGYGIDLVFALMDRIVNAFVTPAAQPAGGGR